MNTCGTGIKVLKILLTAAGEKEMNPKVWAGEENHRWTHNYSLKEKITAQGGSEAVKQRQYPIPLEGITGLKPVVQTLVKNGLLGLHMSLYNTSILPLQKADGTY